VGTVAVATVRVVKATAATAVVALVVVVMEEAMGTTGNCSTPWHASRRVQNPVLRR